MTLNLFTTIFALAVVGTLISGIWLLLHLTSLARAAKGRADVVPSPKPARQSRTTVKVVVAVFAVCLMVTLAMQILAMTGAASDMIR